MKPNAAPAALIYFIIACFLIHSSTLSARELTFIPADSTKESKVDYLEKIYFSGENKEGLLNLIQGTLQDLNGKNATAAVAAQYSFLSGMNSKAQNAKDACEITDMLAAGIYSLDVNEAATQSIPRPAEKVTANLSSVINSSREISASSYNTAWQAWALSGGKANGIGALTTVGKAANTVGNTASTIENTKRTVENMKALGKAILGSRDKPCKTVTPKVIAIGEHAIPQQNTAQAKTDETPSKPAPTTDKKTVISITGMDYEKLSAFEQNIKACAIVKSTVKKFNTPQSTIEVTHTGTTAELLDLMFQTCKSNFNKNNLKQQEEGIIALNL